MLSVDMSLLNICLSYRAELKDPKRPGRKEYSNGDKDVKLAIPMMMMTTFHDIPENCIVMIMSLLRCTFFLYDFNFHFCSPLLWHNSRLLYLSVLSSILFHACERLFRSVETSINALKVNGVNSCVALSNGLQSSFLCVSSSLSIVVVV